MHNKIKGYRCEQFSYACSSKGGLDNHIEQVHNKININIIHSPNRSEDITEDKNIKEMKSSNFRAKSEDGDSSYDLRRQGNNLVKILRLVFNKAIYTGKMFQKFLINHFFIIHKTGDLKDPKNYRSAWVQNHILKTFLKVLNKKIVQMLEIDNKLPEFQIMFRKCRNTVSAAWTLKNIC